MRAMLFVAAGCLSMAASAIPVRSDGTFESGPTSVAGTPLQPIGDAGEWVTPADYPPEALRERRQGIVGFDLAVNPQGRVDGCTVTSSSGSPQLDQAACSLLMQRAAFQPPRDAKGKPTAAHYRNRVRWQIPGDPFRPYDHTVEFDVDTEGRVINCTAVNRIAGAPPSTACDELTKRMPPLEKRAKPTHVRIYTKITVDDPIRPDGTQ